jgi:hypothetical protein
MLYPALSHLTLPNLEVNRMVFSPTKIYLHANTLWCNAATNRLYLKRIEDAGFASYNYPLLCLVESISACPTMSFPEEKMMFNIPVVEDFLYQNPRHKCNQKLPKDAEINA